MTNGLDELRQRRDAAAARGDHGEALVLNDRIHVLKYSNAYNEELYASADVECPSCKARRDNCRLCGGTGVVTERQALDWPEAG